MRNPNTIQKISLIQRLAMRSKFPGFHCHKKGGCLIFTGMLRPAKANSSYKIQAEYTPSQLPKVFVLSPEIHPRAPHLWDDKSLCLFNPSTFHWHTHYLIAKFIIPWTAFWLYFYEGWLETGNWYGPEFPHDDRKK